jgi:hypothetical protein
MNIQNIAATAVQSAGTSFRNLANGNSFKALKRMGTDHHYNVISLDAADIGQTIVRETDAQHFFIVDKRASATPMLLVLPTTHTLTVNDSTDQVHAVLDSVSAADSPNPAGHPAKLEVYVFAVPAHAPVTVADIITDTATGTRFRVRRVNATETTLQRVEAVPV